MKTKKVKINGLKLQFYFWGRPRNPKLFLFHGWLETGAGFEFVCRHLQDKFYCIAPDLRGYGKSEHGKSPLGYFFNEYLADLHEIFNEFSPQEPASVLGHSLSGALLGVYGGIFPERIGHFINVEGFGFRDSAPETAPEKLRRWMEGLHTQRFKAFASQKEFAQRLQKGNPRLPWDRALFLAKHLTRRTGRRFIMSADPLHKLAEPLPYSKSFYYAFWRRIQARCLLVSAEESGMKEWVRAKNFEKEMKERFSQFPKGTQRAAVADCGHMIHHERPEKLAELILDFLPGPTADRPRKARSPR